LDANLSCPEELMSKPSAVQGSAHLFLA